jgi:methionyl-tRNA synthetase
MNTWKDFQTRNNNELVAILGNFVNRTMILTHNYFEGKVPLTNKLSPFDREVLSEITVLKKNVETSLEQYRFREALREAMNLARLGNKYLADTEPWKIIKEDKTRVGTILNISLQITANLCLLLAPFLPFTVKKLSAFINFPAGKWEDIGKENLLSEGQIINKPELLFEKIEDDIIQKQIDKLMKTKAPSNSRENNHSPQKEMITFDDFSKLDIRSGTILEAEKVAKTKKLIKLLIDTGLDKRTVVAGIAEFFEPDQIIGQQVSVVLNLESRNIRGIESQGMILMAHDNEGKLTFVSPTHAIDNGSEIN